MKKIRHQIVGDRGLRDSYLEADQEYNVVVSGECIRCHEPVTIILEVLDNDHSRDLDSSWDADGSVTPERPTEGAQAGQNRIPTPERERGDR